MRHTALDVAKKVAVVTLTASRTFENCIGEMNKFKAYVVYALGSFKQEIYGGKVGLHIRSILSNAFNGYGLGNETI